MITQNSIATEKLKGKVIDRMEFELLKGSFANLVLLFTDGTSLRIEIGGFISVIYLEQ